MMSNFHVVVIISFLFSIFFCLLSNNFFYPFKTTPCPPLKGLKLEASSRNNENNFHRSTLCFRGHSYRVFGSKIILDETNNRECKCSIRPFQKNIYNQKYHVGDHGIFLYSFQTQQ